MTVQDDVRRLSQMDSIYLGQSVNAFVGAPIISWHKGRLQQANDGAWVFRSISSEGVIVGFQLGQGNTSNWSSSETPSFGIIVKIEIAQALILPNTQPIQLLIGNVFLQQQLPPELTN